jgi:hypothetical protein
LDATIDLVLEQHRHHLTRGAVFVDESDLGAEPRVMVMLEHEVANAVPRGGDPHSVVSRRFEFVEVTADGAPRSVAYAPYLDYRPITASEWESVQSRIDPSWPGTEVEDLGLTHAIDVAVPTHVGEVRARTEARLDAIEAAVHERLTREINYLDNRAAQLQLKAGDTDRQRLNIAKAQRQAEELAERLKNRKAELARERSLKALPPRVAGAALVIPAGALPSSAGEELSVDPEARRIVEQRAVNAVLAIERAVGRTAQDMNEVQRNYPGYDVLSTAPLVGGKPGDSRFIEVKGRTAGAPTVTVSRNEILTSLNEPEKWILALVEIHPGGGEDVRYLRRPFEGRSEEFLFDVTSVNFQWAALWERGEQPT